MLCVFVCDCVCLTVFGLDSIGNKYQLFFIPPSLSPFLILLSSLSLSLSVDPTLSPPSSFLSLIVIFALSHLSLPLLCSPSSFLALPLLHPFSLSFSLCRLSLSLSPSLSLSLSL